MKQSLTRDDRGFSLLELLIGVVVLGIIVGPFLNGFFTSAATAKKSAVMRDQTLAAENVVETILSYSEAGLINKIRNGTFPGADNAAYYTYDPASGYTRMSDPSAVAAGQDKYYIGLRNIHTPTGSYDAMVTLDAAPYDAKLNDVPMAEFTPMDAVFTQPSGEQNPDSLAAETIANAATVDSGATVSPAYFTDRMVRVIDVTVTKNTAQKVVTVKARYSYTATYEIDPVAHITKTYTYTYESEFFRKTYTDTDDGISSLYFFYYPNYYAKENDPSIGENINVYNTDADAPSFKVFVIKQRRTTVDGSGNIVDIPNLPQKENAYKAKLALRESAGVISDPTKATLYSNANLSVLTGEKLTNTEITYRVYRGSWYQFYPMSGQLVSKEATNRLYQIDVTLYKSGGSFAAADAVLTFDGAKINK